MIYPAHERMSLFSCWSLGTTFLFRFLTEKLGEGTLEVQCLDCISDPEDPRIFSNLSEAIAEIIRLLFMEGTCKVVIVTGLIRIELLPSRAEGSQQLIAQWQEAA